MAERRAVRLRRAKAEPLVRPKRHESGVLVEVESEWSRSGRSATWLPYGTAGEASREYVETVEILESLQAESGARPTWVKLIHLGRVKDETLVRPTRETRTER